MVRFPLTLHAGCRAFLSSCTPPLAPSLDQAENFPACCVVCVVMNCNEFSCVLLSYGVLCCGKVLLCGMVYSDVYWCGVFWCYVVE